MKLNRASVIAIAALACSFFSVHAMARDGGLATRTGNEVGVSAASYWYGEIGMSESTTAWKLAYSGTYALNNKIAGVGGWFLRGDLSYMSGNTNYTGSGIKNGNPNWYYEIQGLVGKDFNFGRFVLSPYAGLGYRYLYNDLRGLSSTGSVGYRRESHYYMLPIGLNHRMHLPNNAKLSTTIEYDYLLRGRQVSKLSDMVGYNGFTAVQDIGNTQNSGYGIRASIMYQLRNWSVGPYYVYWHISQSDIVPAVTTRFGTSYTAYYYEPSNITLEYGFRVNYQF